MNEGAPTSTVTNFGDAHATIDSVSATPFALRYASAISLSDGIRQRADQVLVTVRTSEGILGHGECIPRPAIYGETVTTACEMIERVLAPRVVGLRVGDLGLLSSRLMTLRGNPAARSSIEIAVFDAWAKSLRVPAHRLLGGAAEHEDVVAHARTLHDRYGVTTFKLKVGANPVDDAKLVGALRGALGELALLYADANGRYTAAEAARFARLAADYGLWGLEEPTDSDDLIGRSRLVGAASIPIIGDETCDQPRAVAAELAAGRCSAVSVKLARTGISSSVRIREHCGAVGAPLVIGTQADSAIGAYASAAFAAASPLTASGPAEVLFFQEFADNPVRELPEIRDGCLWLSDRPGFGCEIDDDLLKESTNR
jgi:L-alanine-DL-glutamate epimerase-like enolase superfamily enzyme